MREFQRRYHDLIIEGEQTHPDQRKSRLIIPFKDAPELEIRYLRLRRELEVQTAVYELLSQQVEAARIEEARNTPTIQVLDYAVPATKKTKPRRMLIVLLWTGLACVTSVSITIFREHPLPYGLLCFNIQCTGEIIKYQ